MAVKRYIVEITRKIAVDLDTEKLTDDFWSDFNSTITDLGEPNLPYLAEHAAFNFTQGEYRFIEGIGDLKEMNINIEQIECRIEDAEEDEWDFLANEGAD